MDLALVYYIIVIEKQYKDEIKIKNAWFSKLP